MPSRLATPLLIAAALALSGCDDAEKAFDCIDDDRPQFSRYELPPGTVGIAYDESITAGINNTPNDGDFSYAFTLEGDLPDGMSFTARDRVATFAGTPLEDGTFLPSLRVEVSDGDAEFFGDNGDADTLCRTTRTATYSLVIEPG